MFDSQELEAPFSSFTPGIGSGLFYDQIDRIRASGSYRNLAGIERPCPYYFRSVFGAPGLPARFSEHYNDYVVHEGSSAGYGRFLTRSRFASELDRYESTLRSGDPALYPSVPQYEPLYERNVAFRQLFDTFETPDRVSHRRVLSYLYEHNGELA